MDKVELRVAQQADLSVERSWSAVFGVAGGTIGRGGQNKLVLPDSDASVARVHAMVRMESDAAYIANLCERRSITVAGQEVRSGEEVPLAIGDEVVIGPYRLYALIPGQPLVIKPAEPAFTAQPVAEKAISATPISFEPISAPVAEPSPFDLPPSLGAQSPVDDSNPFAILGRVSEPGVAPSVDATETAASAIVPSFMASPPESASPVSSSANKSIGAPSTSASSFEPQEAVLPGVVRTSSASPAPSPELPASGWDDVPRSSPAKAAAHRALVIPDDFDLFAQDANRQAQKGDPWAGGLQTKSLSDVANLRHDELLKTLPISGRFEHEMDNPAHTGLPKALDPRNELDPLRLFQQDRDQPAPQEAGPSALGCDLSQAFSMPKSASASGIAVENLAVESLGIEAISIDAAVSSAQALASPSASPAPLPVEQVAAPLVGLRKVDGLNLDSFGDALTVSDSAWMPAVEPVVPMVEKIPAQISLQEGNAEPKNSVGFSGENTDPLPPADQYAAPAQAVSAPAPMPVASSTAGALPPAELNALVTAFLDGAGVLPKKLEPTLTPEFMRSFGEAFRVAVQGTIDLLAARSEIKREFRAGVTVIASGANNPLKFLPTPDGVIMQMIGQNFPGFMQPIPAMKDAYQDLCVHQLALMAGIRAAYAEALSRFDPVELEKQAATIGGMLGKVSSIGRKAALWDEYKKNFDAIRRDAEDDLTAFSGQAFLEAYENAEAAAKAKL
ncbi:type VI secretion system-associated FHA domain protein TagH [Paracidovorax valerianellae]|uniref:type VI secretion system-associated FHA domain protein TagH n=1 Tax=Paracidovorax valerianellae TaxID=187868 RepID=UPI0023022382|nr:type VI secretion system-associated FHA domain protein TagH [Paracidovorax valerianellae]MDA8443757.1 type VI secretion system-associated FHA domain protein TagH [Paracidovorax valerianellae]